MEAPRARWSWAVCGVGLVALVTSAGIRYTEPRTPLAVRAPAIVEVPVAGPAVPSPPIPDEEPIRDDELVVAGTCGVGAPIQTPTSAADAAELRALVAGWIRDERGEAPGLQWSRGILYVESEEDRGDDPPYPRSAEPEARRVCGSEAAWLRASVRSALSWRAGGEPLTCDGNVCCYGGMEYAPVGHVGFRRVGDSWVLDSWVQTYVAALGPDYVRANTRFVERAVARLHAGTCQGEPADRID